VTTNGITYINSLAEAMAKAPVVLNRDEGEHAVECAMQPFAACSRRVAVERFVVILRDGTPVGTCPSWQQHTTAVRQAGTGSEAQRLFTWIVGTFQAANPNRKRGDQAPNKVLSLLEDEPQVVDLATHRPVFDGDGKVTGFTELEA
jgi:hypothetical protein